MKGRATGANAPGYLQAVASREGRRDRGSEQSQHDGNEQEGTTLPPLRCGEGYR